MKPFDKALFDRNDERGREAVKRWLLTKGCVGHDFFKYDVDLIIKKGDKWMGFAEVEVRSWDLCVFNTIHVAKRKEKLLRNAMITYMFVCGNSLEFGYYCTAKEVLSSPLVEVPNKYVRSNEHFYNVPLASFTQIRLPPDVI